MKTTNSSKEVSEQLVQKFRAVDQEGARLAQVFRESFDQIYDGQHTGRYSIDQLSKTESAHLGSIVEINIRREFDGFIQDGEAMDFKIDDVEVDCKYSKNPYGWMIPTEALGHYGMLCHANDEEATFRVGFVYIEASILTRGGNRDKKRTISKAGRSAISWLCYDAVLPPNTLLQLSHEDRARVLSGPSGAARLNELFRTAQKMIIPRGIVATVAQQKDYMKRIRSNGGSRSALQNEGIIILGDYALHRKVAADLNLPIPAEGESVSARVCRYSPGDAEPFTSVEGELWRLARPDDAVEMAPFISNKANATNHKER
ncbi:NaeI family type II restriction endonuclease [Corynebacterium flavescens]|uniref:NaeI family type II restriction endonuclease n=1 Tax=Corynebacterium flavescens TaxID=28028 RepID=UPI000EE78ACE|nr:restriction endonuclease [Corynebacterium flavescens]